LYLQLADHAALHHPQPHVLLRPQRRAPGTTAAALSTEWHREREEGETEGERRTEASDGGGCSGAQGGE
jgi:hypothetical protein